MENSSQQYTRVSESTVNNCGQSRTVGSLKILSLNVCGIKSKLNCPEFIDLIKSYDVIGVQETKLDDIDCIHCIQLPGYEIICKNRKKMTRYRSGGIAVLVNSKFSPFIKFHENKSSLVQWFTNSKRLTNLESDILCGNIYIPPYGSKYAHEDPYLEIQTEFNHYCTGSNGVIMFGDYNSRTANLPDFLAADKFIYIYKMAIPCIMKAWKSWNALIVVTSHLKENQRTHSRIFTENSSLNFAKVMICLS